MDRKNFQLMELFAQNCRIPNTTLGQALHLSKDAIRYRIRKLEEEEYIKQFVLFVDARKLGFTRYHILMRLEANIDNKQALIDRLKTHPYVMWINTFIGRYDIQIIVDATDGFHLNEIREELFGMCNHQVKEYIILTHLFDLEFTQLNPDLDLETKFTQKNDHSFSKQLTTRKFPVKQSFNTYNPNESRN